jgi:SAM-dependent methyltransferase
MAATLDRIVKLIPARQTVRKWIVRGPFEDWWFARRVLRQPDRQCMDALILPAVVAQKHKRVLWVGCQPYTSHYAKWFAHAEEYWTMDVLPEMRKFGCAERHIVGSVLESDRFFKAGQFDLVLLNGVFGFGVDAIPDQERTLQSLHKVMSPNALLVVGWNIGYIPDPVQLDAARRLFRPTQLPPLPGRIPVAGCTHVYDFWTRI